MPRGTPPIRRWLPALVALAAIGCRAPGAPAPRVAPKPTKPAASAAAVVATAASLVGKAKLIAAAGGGLLSDSGGSFISDAGASFISDAASGAISNRSGSLVSDHGGGLVANNGGGVIANNGARYGLHAASALATFALADAEVTLTDARGEQVRDEGGRPLVARTDAQGAFAFTGRLPRTHMVARIRLFNGGELAAIVVPGDDDVRTVDLDTASTLGATYVLGKFVRGDQRVLDRLPRPEADRLDQALDEVRRFLGAAPSYQAADMLAATEALRSRVPQIDRTIGDVRALLLGQAALGRGRLGSQVPLAGPLGLVAEADGTLLIGEGYLGRVRTLAADGTIDTYLDAAEGKVKANVLRLKDLARAPDGTLYALSETTGIYRVSPAGVVDRVLTDFPFLPRVAAVGPDGTLYLGEYTWSDGNPGPKVAAWKPGGEPRILPIDPAWKGGTIAGLAAAPDGSLLVAYEDPRRHVTVYRVVDDVPTLLATLADGGGATDLARAPDGRVLLARPRAGQIVALGQDGSPTPVAGLGGPTATGALRRPDSLAVGPDGTIYVGDGAASLVYALRADGSFQVIAGSDALSEDGDATAFAINQPAGLAFDDAGALYVAESGSSRVRRYYDGKLTIFAGSETGYGGDGGPATAAQLSAPAGLAWRDGALWIGEAGGSRVRRVAPDGTISTVLGATGAPPPLVPGLEVPATGRAIPQVSALTFMPDGRLVLATGTGSHQVLRYTPAPGGGTLRAIVGQPRFDGPDVYNPAGYVENDETDPAGVLGFPNGLALSPGGELHFAELVGCRVSKLVEPPDGGPAKLVRVAGRTVAQMIQAASDASDGGPATTRDGVPATETSLSFPTAVAFDRHGTMYLAEAGTVHIGALGSVSDQGANAVGMLATGVLGLSRNPGRIRKVSADGVITTVAGRGTRFFAADAGDDALVLPMAIAIAPDGRLAIADTGANMIRILPAGSY